MKSAKLKDLPIQIIDGDRSPRYPKRDEFQEDGILFLNTTNIIDNRLDLSDANYISHEKFSQLSKGKLQPLDIVMTTRGSIGKVALFNHSLHRTGFINAQMLIFRSDGKVIDPFYLYYFLCSSNMQGLIKNFASGSAQPQIPITDLREIEIDYPDFPTQRRIANILSAYDNLIENNTRRIRILEQMTQAIYQEWFGKVEKIKGWELKPFSELVDIDPATPVDKQIEKPFVGMNAISEISMIINLNLIEMRTGSSGAKFRNRDVLFPRITPSVENGKGAFVQFLKDGQVAIGSTEIIVFREKELNAEYIYFLSREHEFRGNAINSMVGASGRQRVQQKCFDSFMVAKPPKKLLEEFADIVSPMFKITHTLALKNANLRQTRDLLLPRLVSGEVEV